MKKKGNISFVAFIALIVVCCGAAVLAVASNSKYNAMKEYQRIEERYIAESGIDTATGLFINYLANRDLILAYTKNEDGGYSVIDEFSPYISEEIKESEDEDIVRIKIVESESRDYLAGVGFLDYIKDETIQIGINTFGEKESFKISEMCTEYDFLLSLNSDDNTNKRSKLKPIYLTVKTNYRGGEVMADVKISNLYAEREAFPDIGEGEMGSVRAFIDTENAEIEFENYQNYRSVGK